MASGPETPMFKDIEEYAHKQELQDILHKMLTDLMINKPERPLEYMVDWLGMEKKRREAGEA